MVVMSASDSASERLDVVQEAIVVIKDIFRKYPNQYESIITKLCENLESEAEPSPEMAGKRAGPAMEWRLPEPAREAAGKWVEPSMEWRFAVAPSLPAPHAKPAH